MDNFRNQEPFAKQGLYDPRFEHDNCEPVKMPKAKQVMVLVFFYRFVTNFSKMLLLT